MRLVLMLTALTAAIGFRGVALANEFGTVRSCERPVAPKCMLDRQTFFSRSDQSACDKQVDAFTQALVGYRDCVFGEVQRMISESNDLLSDYQCAVRDGQKCRSK